MEEFWNKKGFWVGFSLICAIGSFVSFASPKELGAGPALVYYVGMVGGVFRYRYLLKNDGYIITKTKKPKINNYGQSNNVVNVQRELNNVERKKEGNHSHQLDREYKNLKDGIEFEIFCAKILKKNGYQDTQVTQASNDYGVDVIAEKEGVKFAIQCKFYSSAIGNSAVQEVSAGLSYYHCHVGVVLTNSNFTKNATELAKRANVLLWDGNKLKELIENAKTAK